VVAAAAASRRDFGAIRAGADRARIGVSRLTAVVYYRGAYLMFGARRGRASNDAFEVHRYNILIITLISVT